MSKADKLTKDEMNQMFQLIKRYSETEMDQWDLWKFDTKYEKVYVSFSREVPKSEEDAYFEISHLLYD
ncbi:hypothetical protein ACJJIX_03670 [Microbulbifer sp. VAAC004]|uniref:hypothetical protein n=1 Tax=unclassified Microbulbifer TaxID=2619833 RepID=UPI0040394307